MAITARQDVQTDDAAPPGFPARLIDRVRKVDGVEAAAGSVFAVGRFVDSKGDPIGNSFAPNFIASLLPDRFETLDVVDGRAPRTAREVTIDTQTADTGDLKVGETLRLAGAHEAKSYEVVGLTKLGDTSFGGAGIAELLLPEAQRITDREGQFDQISVAASDGVSAEELRDRIARVMPRQVQVETGEQAAQRQTEDIADNLKFLRIALLVFAGVSLFVGAFLIFNTFSITVAQRTREFGMLRTLGASRRAAARDRDPRGAGDRPARGGARARRGRRLRLRHQRALQGRRHRPAEHRHGRHAPDGDRLADRGRGGRRWSRRSSPALRATRVTPMAALREAELQDRSRAGARS